MNIKTAIEHWLSVCRQHEYETAGFTLTLHELTDSDLVNLKQVAHWFLDFAPFMFKVIAQKEHARLRTIVTYLTTLQGFQAEAWERKKSEFENRLENVKSWVRQNR